MFILQESSIDIASFKNTGANDADGALVTFEGIVRADQHGSGKVSVLQYIADTPACTTEGKKIMAEALSLFPVTRAVCVQRVGKLNVGETAIWIGVWASHRDEAFKASRYIIEEVKKRLLIWKKEFFADGTSDWVRGCQHEVKV
ncbi:MAG: molybdenum cofactor biosynthesis protein MoaE [Candidatus Omnitrophota bacterium]|nr:molybdenum cofactor biosynthesis protein MoaE [Candidatus Omnitrophota bacterium]